MNSEFLKLNLKDVSKGLALTIIILILQLLLETFQTKGLDFTSFDWGKMLDIAIKGGAAYLLKNLFSTSDGKIFGKIG